MNNFNLSVQVRLATRKADKACGGIGTGYGNVKIFKHKFLQYLKLSLYSAEEMAHKVAPFQFVTPSALFCLYKTLGRKFFDVTGCYIEC